VKGIVAPTLFNTIRPWGSFLNTPTLSYSPPAAAFRTAIALSFVCSAPLEDSQTVILTLPDMSAASGEGLYARWTAQNVNFSGFVRWGAADRTLELDVPASIPGQTPNPKP